MYGLNHGTIAREAVTQILDYASALVAMSVTGLADDTAARSGNDGIQQIGDFDQWYADKFGVDDLSRLLSPRIVPAV